MSNPTTYLVLVGGTEVARKSKKASAITAADALRDENPNEEITVQTSAGHVVHTVKMKGTHAKPWTRTETHDGIEVEVPNGYTVAYTRKRVGAVVARADDKSGWVVLTESGDRYEVANTVQAREVTNTLAVEYARKRDEEKAAAAQEKAERKAAREQERADKKAAREAEKAEKAAAKAQAKADKEAAATAA